LVSAPANGSITLQATLYADPVPLETNKSGAGDGTPPTPPSSAQVAQAVGLVGSYELLMTVTHSSQAAPDGASGRLGIPIPDPLQEQAAEVFASGCAANHPR
jgi:hypothetical protein